MDKLNLIILILLALVVSMPASAAITHRYDFVADANDVVGGLESTLVGDAAVTDGELVVDGDGDWLELDAAGIAINTYTTGLALELWHTQDTTDQGFSMTAAFGETDATGRDYVMIATTRGDSVTSGAIANNEPDDTDPWTEERWINYPQEFNDDTEHHYVLTVDDPLEDGSGRLAFYIDGEAVEVDEGGQIQFFRALNGTLVSELSNATAYLGRGVYNDDGSVRGQIDEFRIHDRGLNPGEVIFTDYFGPDNAYPLVLRDLSPAYDDLDPEVIADDIDPGQDVVFSWTPESWIAADVESYSIYIGTDPNIADPNKADVSAYADIIETNLVSTSKTVNGGTEIKFLEDYYWRVDTVMEGGGIYQGAPMKFRTLPEEPYFILQPPAYTFTKADTTISVVAGNTTDYQWYKVVGEQDDDENGETDDTALSPTGVYSTTQTATLTITGIDNAAEGYYYCAIFHSAAPAIIVNSHLARLVKAELKSEYKMETITELPDGNSISPDSAVAGYDMVLASEYLVGEDYFDAGLDFPSLDPNVTDGIASIAGTQSLLFNNSDQNDPNNAWGQYATLPQGVVNYEDITITLWVFPVGGGEWQRIFDFGNGTDDYIFLTPDAGGDPGLRLAMRINGGGEQQLNSSWLQSGSWYHVAITLEGDVGRMFVNGDEVNSNTSMTLNPSDFNPADNLIADSQYPADPFFNGALDDIRIYSYALTPAEVAGLYTEVKTSDYVCVEDPENPIDYDLNDDCRVDLEDVAALAGRWLDCERIPTEACGWSL